MTISREKIDSILETVDEGERLRLTTLYNAAITNLKAYQDDSTATKLKNWKTAEAALEETIADIVGEEEEQKPDGNEIIGRPADVLRWLQIEQYCAPGREEPIKSTKLYEDIKTGLLTFVNRKAISLNEIKAYIHNAQLYKLNANRDDEVSLLRLQILQQELRRRKADVEKKEFQNELDKKNYIKKDEVELQTAIKLSYLDAHFKNIIRSRSSFYLSEVEKSKNKPRKLFEMIVADLEDAFNQAGQMEEIGILITRQSQETHDGETITDGR